MTVFFYVCDTYVWIHVFQNHPPKAVLRNRYSSISKKIFCKSLWKSSLVKLMFAYCSTKDKLLLKYFIRKTIWKKTSWWLLLTYLRTRCNIKIPRCNNVSFIKLHEGDKYFFVSDIWKKPPEEVLPKRCS